MRAFLALVCSLTALVAAPVLARAGDGVAILPLVAEDAQIVGVIDVKDARDAKMFDQGVQLMLDRATEMKDMLAMVGLELKDVHTVLVAGRYGSSGSMAHIDQNLMAVVEGGFTKKKVIKALDAIAGVQTKKKRGIKYWVTSYAEAAIIGKRLVVTMVGGMPGVIDRAKKKAKGFTKSTKAAALRAALAYTDTRHDSWIIALPPTGLAATLKNSLKADMVSYAIGVTLESSMTLEVKVQTKDVAQADALLTSLQGQLKSLKQLAGQVGLSNLAASLTVAADADVIDLDATLTPAELEKVLDLVGMVNP